MKTKHIVIEILPRAMWLIEFSVLGFIYYHSIELISFHTDALRLIVGIIFTLLGITALVSTFKSIAKAMISKKLIVSGLYKYIRHPMYTSMYALLIGIGLFFFTQTWFIVLLIFIPVWYSIALAEESQMTDLYPDEYPKYKKQSGMFLPRI